MTKEYDIDRKLLYPIKGNKRKSVTVGVLKAIYMTEDTTPESLAERYNLSVDAVNREISAGNWDNLRAQNRAKGIATIQKQNSEQIEDLLDIEQKVKALKIIQIKSKIQWLVDYVATHGDLFARNERTGEVMKDPLGQPISLKIPFNNKEIMEFKEQLNLSQGMLALLQSMPTPEAEEIEDKNTINIDNYDFLFKKEE